MNCIELKPLMAKFIKGQIIAFGDIHLVLDIRLLLFEKDFHTSIKSIIFIHTTYIIYIYKLTNYVSLSDYF